MKKVELSNKIPSPNLNDGYVGITVSRNEAFTTRHDSYYERQKRIRESALSVEEVMLKPVTKKLRDQNVANVPQHKKSVKSKIKWKTRFCPMYGKDTIIQYINTHTYIELSGVHILWTENSETKVLAEIEQNEDGTITYCFLDKVYEALTVEQIEYYDKRICKLLKFRPSTRAMHSLNDTKTKQEEKLFEMRRNTSQLPRGRKRGRKRDHKRSMLMKRVHYR